MLCVQHAIMSHTMPEPSNKTAAEIAAELHLSMRALPPRSSGASSSMQRSRSRQSSGGSTSHASTLSAATGSARDVPTSAACDRCRRLKTKCERRFEPNKPCSRCTKAGLECTNDDTLLLPGPPKRSEKLRFWESGVPYKTFREAIKEQRKHRQGSIRRPSAPSSSSHINRGSSASPALASSFPTASSSMLAQMGSMGSASGHESGDAFSDDDSSSVLSGSAMAEHQWSNYNLEPTGLPATFGSLQPIPFIQPHHSPHTLPQQQHAQLDQSLEARSLPEPIFPTAPMGEGSRPPAFAEQRVGAVPAFYNSPSADNSMTGWPSSDAQQQAQQTRHSGYASLRSYDAAQTSTSSWYNDYRSPGGSSSLPLFHSAPAMHNSGSSTATGSEAMTPTDHALLLPDAELEALFPLPDARKMPSSIALGPSTRYVSTLDNNLGLFLDESGAIQVAPPLPVSHPAEVSSRLLRLYQSSWSIAGPGGLPISPPWGDLADTSRPLSLWPELVVREEDFDRLRAQASQLILHPAVTRLVKRHFAATHHAFPVLYAPHFFDRLGRLISCARTLSFDGMTPVEVRHALSLVLMLCAIAGFVDPGATISLNGAENGQRTAAVSLDQFSFHCYKLGWALAQPRRVGYAQDEFTTDLPKILRLFTLPLGVHQHGAALRLHACRTLAGSRWMLSNLLQAHASKTLEIEELKRVLADCLATQTHHRLWSDRSFRLPDADSLQARIGYPEPISGEFHDDPAQHLISQGASDRRCVLAYLLDVGLDIVLQKMLDSPLFVPSPPGSASSDDAEAARTQAAQRVYADLRGWVQRLAQSDWAYGSPAQAAPSKQQAMAQRYWRSKLRARFHAVLDLTAANVHRGASAAGSGSSSNSGGAVAGAQEPADLRMLFNSAPFIAEGPAQPDENDRVWQWLKLLQ